MKKLTLTIWDAVHATIRVSNTTVLGFMMLSICYDTIMRYVIAKPTSWSLEVNSFLIVYLAVIGAAEAQRKNAHIRVDFMVEKFPIRGQAVIQLLTAGVGMAFAGIMTWRGFMMSSQALEYGERVSSAFGTPMFIPFGLLPVGFGLLALQFGLHFIDGLRQLIHPESAPTHPAIKPDNIL